MKIVFGWILAGLDDDLMAARIQTSMDGEYLQITGDLSFKASVYQPRQYSKLRSEYSNVLEAMNQMIILSRN